MDKIKLPSDGFFYTVAALAAIGVLAVVGLFIYGLVGLFSN